MRKWRLISASSLPLKFTTFGCALTSRIRFTDKGKASAKERLRSSAGRLRSGPKSNWLHGKRFLPRIWPNWCTNTHDVMSASNPASCEASTASSAPLLALAPARPDAVASTALAPAACDAIASRKGKRYSTPGNALISKLAGNGPPGVPCVCEAACPMKSHKAFSVAGGCSPTSNSCASARYFVSKVCGKSCNHADLNSCMLSGKSP
mmetsp:Transcript_86979/g.266272  ORF Transcript_86979/g.266272 Transcript_86979/m.266272 type:complete len:207 (+) Transcript_86979:369-989(+)